MTLCPRALLPGAETSPPTHGKLDVPLVQTLYMLLWTSPLGPDSTPLDNVSQLSSHVTTYALRALPSPPLTYDSVMVFLLRLCYKRHYQDLF